MLPFSAALISAELLSLSTAFISAPLSISIWAILSKPTVEFVRSEICR